MAYHVRRLNKSCKNLSTSVILNHIEAFEKNNNAKLSDEQQEAVIKALQNDFTVLTGLPGAGKTFTINAIINIYMQIYPDGRVCPLAPTGKASRRIQELTGLYAQTVHRALELNERIADRKKPIDVDFIIVDEASMLDIYLAGTLLQCIENNTKVLIVGDIEQLPSIGAGLILRDIIDSGVVQTTRLTKLFRQAEDSNIVRNAHAIAKGTGDFKWEKDSIFWEAKGEADTLNKLLAGYKKLRDSGNSMTSIGILAPANKSNLGTIAINQLIQKPFNRNSKGVVVDAATSLEIKVNDMVMQTKNNYEKEIFNGEIGVVEKIEGTVIHVKYADREEAIEYNEAEYNQLTLAYCITIHKSQGSEYNNVIIIVDEEQELMLNKNLIYTAITRAKKFLVVLGDKETFNRAIQNNDAVSRLSSLKEKLQGKVFNQYAPLKDYAKDNTFTVKTRMGDIRTYTLTDELFLTDEDEIF